MMPPCEWGGHAMQGKIALEEHLAIEATLGDSKVFGAHVWDTLHPRLFDVQEIRLREMDKHGIEMMILSLNAPAIQAIHEAHRLSTGGPFRTSRNILCRSC